MRLLQLDLGNSLAHTVQSNMCRVLNCVEALVERTKAKKPAASD